MPSDEHILRSVRKVRRNWKHIAKTTSSTVEKIGSKHPRILEMGFIMQDFLAEQADMSEEDESGESREDEMKKVLHEWGLKEACGRIPRTEMPALEEQLLRKRRQVMKDLESKQILIEDSDGEETGAKACFAAPEPSGSASAEPVAYTKKPDAADELRRNSATCLACCLVCEAVRVYVSDHCERCTKDVALAFQMVAPEETSVAKQKALAANAKKAARNKRSIQQVTQRYVMKPHVRKTGTCYAIYDREVKKQLVQLLLSVREDAEAVVKSKTDDLNNGRVTAEAVVEAFKAMKSA